MKTIEICLSPALYEYRSTCKDYIVVVIDVLRATSAFCAAFDNGVKSIIPVVGLEITREYKDKGFPVVAERGGLKVDFADFANSPLELLKAPLKGSTLVYSTTNGTQAIEKAKDASEIAVGCFSNISVLCEWLHKKNRHILILCSGWENTVSLEDTTCAGAIVETLINTGQFSIMNDSAYMALNLWKNAHKDLIGFLSVASHFKRLEKLGCQNDLVYCLQKDISDSLPVWNGKELVDLSDKLEVKVKV